MTIKNGTVWKDTQGNIVHAHGGYIIKYEDMYYWYGENRLDNIYVSCYSSKDLVNWTFCNHVLTADSKTEEIRVRTDLRLRNEEGKKVNIERPKVLYHRESGRFVMWMHYENGKDYCCAAAAVATCDTPTGDFVYHGSFNPYGYMSRDCTLFEDNGRAYFLSSSRDNADMHMYLLQDDFMNIERLIAAFWQGEYREAPALVKKDDMYYLFTSFCTGWAPNQGKYAKTDCLEKGFGKMKEIGDETTYHSQPAFILKLKGKETVSYIYVGDRWNGENYHDSRYVWYPLIFHENGDVELVECKELDIDVETGRIRY